MKRRKPIAGLLPACRRKTCGTRAGPNSAAGRRGRRRSAYEAPRAAADGGTRLGGAESKRRRRSRLPAPPSRVTLLVYEFHDGPARELFKRYNYGQLDLAVAHAIVAGILDRSRLQGELVEALGRAIAFYEERGQT